MRGAVARQATYDVPHGASLANIVDWAGGTYESPLAFLVGGYFGRWVPAAWADRLWLDDESLAASHLAIGCGAVCALTESACGVAEAARVLGYLARESAGQCGPCRHGLPALAGALQRIADGGGSRAELEQLARWSAQLASGRGACKHPDGAVGMLQSALQVSAGDVQRHLRNGPCPG